jgi:hypothetical protein
MPPDNALRHKRGGIGQPVGPPGATHVDYPTVLVAHDDEEVRGGEQILFERPGTKGLLMSGQIAGYETQRLWNTRWHVC